MRWLWLDDYYPEAMAAFERSLPPESASWDGEQRHAALMRFHHGTADYFEQELRKDGHESLTVVENARVPTIAGHADVVAVQNVGRHPARNLLGKRSDGSTLLAFCSYDAEIKNLVGFDCVFTSFLWLKRQLDSIGQRSEFLPLAFSPSVLEGETPDRDIPICFPGGIGGRIWLAGLDAMVRISEHFGPEAFHWYGYRNAPVPPVLQACHRGEAWGPDYFRVLQRSRIVVNRHGEIAKGSANNMRLFEATGCGACLVTEHAPNIGDYFTPGKECMTYRSAAELIDVLSFLIANPKFTADVAKAGQERCLAEHTYAHRYPKLMSIVNEIRGTNG